MVLQGFGMVHSRWFYRVLVWFIIDGFTGFGMVYSAWFYRVLVWFTVDGFTGFWYGS